MSEQTPLEVLHEIVNREAYQQIIDDLAVLRVAFIDDDLMFANIKALTDIMPRFKSQVQLPIEPVLPENLP